MKLSKGRELLPTSPLHPFAKPPFREGSGIFSFIGLAQDTSLHVHLAVQASDYPVASSVGCYPL